LFAFRIKQHLFLLRLTLFVPVFFSSIFQQVRFRLKQFPVQVPKLERQAVAAPVSTAAIALLHSQYLNILAFAELLFYNFTVNL
jgi:hypothetical protein